MRQGKVARCFNRWAWDLREITKGFLTDPLMFKPGRLWQADFLGQINREDTRHAIFLAIFSILPAVIFAIVLPEPLVKSMARLFGAPVQAVISGFLTSALIFMGSYLNHVPRPYPVAFKLMLRIMAVYPLLGFFSINEWGSAAALLVYGIFVVRGVRKSYPIPLRNALLFFGMIYALFALFQLQAILNNTPAPPPVGSFSLLMTQFEP